jgi:cell division septation protein DedD
VAKERSAAIEQLARAVFEERKRLMEDLFAGGEGYKGLFTDLRQIIEAGNELATRINTAATSIDTLAARFDTRSDQKRFEIGDFHQIVSEFSLSTKQLNTLVRSIDELLTSAKLERPLPVAFKLTDRVENLGRTWMKESFILGATLILLFFIVLLLYRVVSQRLVESRKGQTLTALLLVAGAACVFGYLAFSGGTSSQAVVPASDPMDTAEPRNAVHRTADPAKGSDLQTRMIQADIPTDPILTPSPPSTSTSSSPSVPAQGIKEEKALPENAVRVRTPAPQPPTPAYSIQLGSFRNPSRAEKRVHLLSSLGLKAFSRRVDLPDKGVFHRVLVGTFATRAQARAVQDRLLKQHHLTESLIVSCATH